MVNEPNHIQKRLEEEQAQEEREPRYFWDGVVIGAFTAAVLTALNDSANNAPEKHEK